MEVLAFRLASERFASGEITPPPPDTLTGEAEATAVAGEWRISIHVFRFNVCLRIKQHLDGFFGSECRRAVQRLLPSWWRIERA